ncbi:FAD-dependent oxidoreductase [Actinoalloteichus sp. AHMU CJ021]|uniref:2-polyprenyl-6-methoxyphenol hydroxylase n=1 Tax=Actinoalloteichus caeruleus DSM 43889 TaxID=1120930 RepID=A0ABT1JN19_ACTCY|nr:FAD-dependent monooxygenase [Actinoalloteichus caeruleus]AUS81792.1 FAD-dependent oxidoreductase [Actinoalloteichus sp. AHMU CJ021]MCP2333906.1 2-polyprenyl-6-methoxyphenol hydroxylase [Actinoalloteichus caeruleus DSM 43889]
MTRVLVIGGGIAGTVAAVALRRAGLDPVVYEGYDRTADGVGAYLGVATNGQSALAELGLLERALAAGFDTPRMAFRTGSGRFLAELAQGGALPDGTVTRTVRRSDLYRALRDAALDEGVRVEYGRRLVGLTERPDGVTARFADGSEATGDLLVGADGLRSRVRGAIDPGAPSGRYVGLLNTGGFAPGVPVDAEPGVANMVFGRRCFFAYYRHPDGEVWWFANPPRAQEASQEELDAIDPTWWRAHLLELVARDRTPAARIIAATERIMPPWNTYDLPSVPTWHTDRCVLVGDSAHATSPSSGQGASLAIEDALVLAKCLRDVPDHPAALATYTASRRDRVERVVAQGKRNGDQKAPGPVARVVRDLALPVVFRRMARAEAVDQRWLYEYRVDWEAPITAAVG